MSRAPHSTILDWFLDPVADCLTPEVARRIVALRLDPEIQARLDTLAAKANEGQLSSAERAEYEEFVEAIDLFSILKVKAKIVLAKHAS